MKCLGFVLAVYVILLSAVPCCRFDDCPEDKIEQTGNHEQGEEDCGTCSPFFVCDGCMATAFTTEPMILQSAFSVSPKIFTGYIESTVPDIHYEFWQPPKIA